MELTQTHDIPLAIGSVWTALNDPDILARSIPGCEQLEQHSATELSAKVKLKIGPVSANFIGAVTLSDINPPHAYVISGSGKAGVAGAGAGKAKVTLEEIAEGTRLSYVVEATVSGKIAQLGSRLIESTAKKLATRFFDNFVAIVTQDDKQIISKS